MRIGIEINSAVFDIKKYESEQGKKFDKQYDKLGLYHILKYCSSQPINSTLSEFIEKLYKEGHEVCFIMDERLPDVKDGVLKSTMRLIINKRLENFKHKKIFFCTEDHNIVKTCERNYIDVIISNNATDVENVGKVTNAIRFDLENSEMNIDSFENLLEKITAINEEENQPLRDKDQPITGRLSIDQSWLQFYKKGQNKLSIQKDTVYRFMRGGNLYNLDGTAFNYYGKKTKFKKLLKQIDECSKSLTQAGIKKGDVVAIGMPNTPEAIIAFYALNKIGAVAQMIHPLVAENELKHNLNLTGTKMLVAIDTSYNNIKNIIDDTSIEQVIVVSPKDSMSTKMKLGYSLLQTTLGKRATNVLHAMDELKKIQSDHEPIIEKVNNEYKTSVLSLKITPKFRNNYLKEAAKYSVEKNPKIYDTDKRYVSWADFIRSGKKCKEDITVEYEENMPAAILPTGGTTGPSKGAIVSNDNINAIATQYRPTDINFNEGDMSDTISPLFHGLGLGACIHMMLSFGVGCRLIAKFSIKELDKITKKDKTNIVLAPPAVYFAGMVDNPRFETMDLSSFKHITLGGAEIKEADEIRGNEFASSHGADIKITKSFGLTEAVASVTYSYPNCNAIGSFGIPLIDTVVKVVKPGTHEEVPYGKQGELCVRGPQVFMGYHNNPEETAIALQEHEDGYTWLHTGDIVYFTEEGLGYFVDRHKRMFTTNGYNIFPAEIEKVISNHPAVKSCIVIGADHKYKGKEPIANIVLNEGYEPNDIINTEISHLCEKNISRFALPKIKYRDSLPLTLLNKPNYRALEDENRIPEESKTTTSVLKKLKFLKKTA